MTEWAKIKFFWDQILNNEGSSLVADSTDTMADYDVDYLFNIMETNFWRSASTTDPQYITLDLGVSGDADADYLAILGHNLNTIGAIVTLQYSNDNFSGDINDAFTGEAPAADTVYLKRFTAPSAQRYWRLKLSDTMSAAPFMAICIWGEETELDWVQTAFDPHAETVVANRTVSYAGFITGTHIRHTERTLQLSWNEVESALYDKVRAWWDGSGLNNFFVAWDVTNNASDVYLMRPDMTFNAPFSGKGDLRNITIRLKGRKE